MIYLPASLTFAQTLKKQDIYRNGRKPVIRAILLSSDSDGFPDLDPSRKRHENFAYLLCENNLTNEHIKVFAKRDVSRFSLWVSVDCTQLDNLDSLRLAVRTHPQSLVLRNCRSPKDVEKASALLTVCEIEEGFQPGFITLLTCLSDAPSSIRDLPKWTFLPDRLKGLIFDPHALAQAMKLPTIWTGKAELSSPLQTAGDLCLITAAALGLPIYDTTDWTSSRDIANQYWSARQLGFAGALTSDARRLSLISQIYDQNNGQTQP